ncbi:MAG: hypothetical protein SWX82_24870 [Cyanobacteriota bacterium]|nr:hypothetical protein [Cyanobacteriota bacterium]
MFCRSISIQSSINAEIKCWNIPRFFATFILPFYFLPSTIALRATGVGSRAVGANGIRPVGEWGSRGD